MIVLIACSAIFSCFGFMLGTIHSRYWSKNFIKNHRNQLEQNIEIVNINFQAALKLFEIERKKIDD